MSKARLLRYYRAADIVADQFTVGSYGASSLEAMSCSRPLLIHLDPARFDGRFDELPPVINVSEADEIADALRRLLEDAQLRSSVGEQGRRWVVENHGPPVARDVLSLCRQVVDEWPHKARSVR